MPPPEPIVVEDAPVLNALAHAWATIRHHHPELPDAIIDVAAAGSGTDQHLRHRHFAATQWQHDDPRLSIAEDGLSKGAVVVLGALLHEAAHALAHVRNINDTSHRGRCHSRRVAKLAEQLGLEHDRRRRRSSSIPTTDSIARYRTALDNLDRALHSHRHRQPNRGDRTPSTNPVACACDGGRRIRVSRTTLGIGPIICQVCGSQFNPQ